MDQETENAREPGRRPASAAGEGAHTLGAPRERRRRADRRALGRRALGRLALAALASGLSCAGAPPPSLPTSLYGATMPAFRRAAIDGREVSSAALRGRVVVVEFFASYCAPCRRSLPALVELAARDPSLAVVAIGEDERRDLTAAMAAEYGLTMPVVHDAGNLLAARFRIDGLPSTFVIDERGVIRWFGGADHSARTLARVVAAVRSDRPAS
ncbi:MAG: TlpA disulfide reductase family protein [Nannocystaceae bacterium]